MKMQIEDLMDLYVGEDAAELGERLPPLPEPGKGRRKPVVPMKKRSHVRRTVGIAASILIVLGIAGALMLGFGNRQTGSTLAPGETPPNVSQWGVIPSEEPETEKSAEQEAVQSTEEAQPDDNTSDFLLIEGASSDYAYCCQGNLFFDGKQYYTLQDGRIVPTEVQTIHIDFYAYGDWNLYIDYIIDQDGELALRDRSVNEDMFYVERISGSSDTLRIMLRRDDQPRIGGFAYPVFYNIKTGVMSDPLANVPELYDHGTVYYAQISPSMQWALVQTQNDIADGDSNSQTDGGNFLCNLETGTMLRLETQMPMDETQNLNLSQMEQIHTFWGSDDTLYVWLYQSANQDNVEEQRFLAAYEPDSGTLRYVHQMPNSTTVILSESRDYIGDMDDGTAGSSVLITDAKEGKQWQITDVYLGGSYDEVPNRMVFAGTDGQIYLVDEVKKGYACLNDRFAMPKEAISVMRLQSEHLLCIYTERGCSCYALPDDLLLAPMTEVGAS